jgi:hypothetical protein
MLNMFENGTLNQNTQTSIVVDEKAIQEMSKKVENYQAQVDAWITEFVGSN